MQYQGITLIRINGREYPTSKGSSFETGGKKRNPVAGQRAYGWQVEYVHARLSCQIFNNDELSAADLNAMEDVTITVENDKGRQWLMPNAWCEGNAQFTDGGSISVSFAAVESKEI